MHHYEEYILELYVLGAPEVDGEKSAIRAHLEECYGCRALAEEITEFYGNFAKEGDATGSTTHPSGDKLSRLPRRRETARSILARRQELDKLFSYVEPGRPSALKNRIGFLIRRHPVVTGAGIVGTMAVLAFSLIIGSRHFFMDTNPAYTNYSDKSGLIQVYNKENDMIWSLPAFHLDDIERVEGRLSVSMTQTVDLDGRGRNSVVTLCTLRGSGSEPWRTLKVFDNVDHERWQKLFSTGFRYRDRKYTSDFQATSFAVVPSASGKGSEIICIAENAFSPAYISRIDPNGNILGEYWHFGHFNGIYAVDVTGDHKKEIVVCGMNDLADSTHDEFGVIMVLNPYKISGKSSASLVDGYGLPHSDAELYYIRIPWVDLNRYYHQKLQPENFQFSGDGSLLFNLSTGNPDNADYFWFQVHFAHDMTPIEIRSGDNTDKLHDKLVGEGVLTGRIDSLYLAEMKRGIRYWDGSSWQSYPVGVGHPHPPGI
jgi:hypothetical protein